MEDLPVEPTRHEALYFPDGNVVICSAGTGEGPGRVAFRVHKSVLSFHSTMFKDMFSLPAVDGVNETYDGVPLVNTTDNANGWEDLLGALYHTKCARILHPSDFPTDDFSIGPCSTDGGTR